MNEINKGTRIINFVFDILFITIISSVLSSVFYFISSTIIYYSVYLVYYFIFEYFLSQTLGKMITKTKVVDMENLKPSLRKILYRTILRLNPFDAVSYLFGNEQGGHDLISKTRLKIKGGT